MTEKRPGPARDSAIDLTKAVAIVGVLLIHASATGGFRGPVGGADWCGALLWGTVLRCAVPLFFLCSGALLLNPDRVLSVRQVCGKYLLRILVALLFWAAAYEAFQALLYWHRTGAWAPGALRSAAANLLLFRHRSHLYYLHILLLVYALLLVTRAFVAAAPRRTLEYALAAWAALGVLLPAARALLPEGWLTGIPAQYPLNLTWGAVGYTVLGWYLRRRAGERRPAFWAGLYAVGLALTFCGTLALSLQRGGLYEGFLSGMAPGVCLEAAGLFGLLQTVGAGPRPWAETLSRASFCIYLTHRFFLDLLRDHGWTARFSPVWSVPALALALLGCGFGVWLALRRVPWVKKWLV